MVLKELNRDQFDFFINNYQNPTFYQTKEYADAMSKQKYNYIYYGLEEDNKLYGATMILIEKRQGFKYAYAPRGFLLDYTNKDLLKQFTTLLKKELGKKGVIAIKINPAIVRTTYNNITANIDTDEDSERIFGYLKDLGFYHLGYNNFFESLNPRFEAILNIDEPSNQLFNKLNEETKTKIENADYSGLKIYKSSTYNPSYLFLDKKEYEKKANLYQELFYSFGEKLEFYYVKLETKEYLQHIQMRYQDQSQITNEANAKVFQTRGSDNTNEINMKLQEENKLNDLKNELVYATNLLRDFPQGIIIGSCITIKTKDTVSLVVDTYDQNYKQINCNYLLIWKLIEKYSNDGFKKFNLGGIANYSLTDNPYQELNDFKLCFNSTAYEYLGDFELITNKPLYAMYQNSSPFRNMLNKKS